nr:MAG TPA: hypothetical protein [Caudoviricetes sp.]
MYQLIAIGNPLMLSPDFPPHHTVREPFNSYGVPSFIFITNDLSLSLHHLLSWFHWYCDSTLTLIN